MGNVASIMVYLIGIGMALAEFGVNLGPLIAGAGIVGVALGFGAQSLVKDFLSGIFMFIEDQYGVGDIIDVGEASGVVEVVNLSRALARLKEAGFTVTGLDADGTVALYHITSNQLIAQVDATEDDEVHGQRTDLVREQDRASGPEQNQRQW